MWPRGPLLVGVAVARVAFDNDGGETLGAQKEVLGDEADSPTRCALVGGYR
jgi:hypothetical protein